MKAHLRRLVRGLVIQAFWWSGITRLLRQRLCAANSIVVLMLHRVLSDAEKQHSNSEATMVVGDRVYVDMIEHIRRHYRLVDASSPQIPFEGERLGIALTFDDGWEDNFEPLMRDKKAHNVPAVVFVSPSLVEMTGPFWPEQVRAILADASEADLRVEVERMKPLSPVERKLRLQELAESNGRPDVAISAVDKTMSWEQLAQLQAAGIELGSHTLDHEILTSLDGVSQIDWQLAESKRQIERRWGHCELLAYPNGNHNDEVVKRAALTGYRRAFIVKPGVWTKDTDPLRIPRMNITDQRVAFGGEFSPAAFEFSVICRAYRSWRAEQTAGATEQTRPVNVRAQAGD